MQVTDEMVQAAFMKLPNRHLMNKKDVRAALTAALSAEQTQPVAVKALEWSEPVGYQQLKDGKWVECSHFVAFGWSDRLDKDCRPIYAHAPLSREGEDTAEVWPVEPTDEMIRALFTLNSAIARTTEEVKAVYQNLRALAATRSGSAREAKGNGE